MDSKPKNVASAIKVAAVTAFGDVVRKTSDNTDDKGTLVERIKSDLKLPASISKSTTAEFACQEASCTDNNPVQVWMKTNFNINAKYGGGTALLLLQRRFEGSHDSELQLVRCGFDGNHLEGTSLALTSPHTIYHWHELHTDSDGNLCPAAMHGNGHCCIVSNIASMGHCGCAVIFEAPKGDSDNDTTKVSLGYFYGSAELPLNTTPLPFGCLLVLCSTVVDGKEEGNVYFIDPGVTAEELFVKPLSPDKAGLWQFEGSEDGELAVKGPGGSHIAVIHSFSEEFVKRHQDNPVGKVYHTQTYDGTKPTTLLADCSKYLGRTLLLMCSCGSGPEDATTSALYQVTLQESDLLVSYIGGSSGTLPSPSVWTFSLTDDNALVVTGPQDSCRYGYIANIPEDVKDPANRCQQSTCLATGQQMPLQSGVKVRDNKTIIGWVSSPVAIQIWLNSMVIERVGADQLLEQPDGRLAFQRELSEDERSPGLKLVRIYALQQDGDNDTVPVELEGSPLRLTYQPEGVIFAVNLGGPMYEASDNVVYEDQQSLFTFDEIEGYQCRRMYGNYLSKTENLYALIANTKDGFLYSTCVGTNYDEERMRDMKFEIPLPRGEYILKIHCVGSGPKDHDLFIDGKPYSSQITAAVPDTHDVIPGLTANEICVRFVAEGGTTTIHFYTQHRAAMEISALVIVDANKYMITEQSEEDEKNDALEAHKLSDQLVPMERTFLKKEMKIAGWSSNLLLNSTGEAGDMSHWDASGEWKVDTYGGDQTETRFVSSYMTCQKSQEIDLTKHFSEEYLDTSPQIQACESFHEGCNHGGYYSLTVTLKKEDGEVIAEKTTDEKSIEIEQRDWIKESFTFKGYEKGLRRIRFETTAHDDKFWAGHFGALTSAALVRVKSQAIPGENDSYADVVEDALTKDALHDLTKVIADLNGEYKEQLSYSSLPGSESDDRSQIQNNLQETTTTASAIPRKARRPKKREIRVFVSSTFVDFKDEREILIKKVFRELNRLCLDRGVFFSYVDLRWGITTEQSKDGKTIFICLSEVDRCRPYFICLLGDRFGWHQRENNKDTLLDATYDYALRNLKGFDWLEDFRYDTSVTKLEILHAALRLSDVDQKRTFFYLRESRVKREELPKPEEKKRGESQWHYDQQQNLRAQVREKGQHSRDFSTAEDGCAKIKEDLMRCINADFPPGSQLTHIEQEREAHEAFAEVRKRVYIGREEYFHAIDKHFHEAANTGDNSPLVILGTSGSGKSALVANWCGRFEEKNPDDFLFMHFIGSSAESASHLNLLRRLYEELREYLQQDLTIPTSERSLVLELPMWLKLASNRGNRVMLVFDALNQLDSGAGYSGEEQELKWLPKELPPNVYLLMSTLPGKAKDAVDEAGWPTIQVYPLNPTEKMEIITTYMSLYSKTLNKEQLAVIVEAKQSNNPLYLKALLDEVRVFGSFEHLTNAIKDYVKAKDPGELFVKILERLESDFESGSEGRTGLVRDTTVAIWCAHRGMSEQELLNYLQVQSHVWSPFYLSLEENLVNRNGLLNFFHDYMRQAVERKYLSTPEDKQKGYVALAEYFTGEDIDNRYVDEVPYLLAKAGDMKRLRATVLNIAVFRRLMNSDEGKYQLIKSWQLLGGYDKVEEEYLGVLLRSDWKTVGDKANLMKAMAGFFNQLGLLTGAKLLLESLLKELEEQHTETDGVIVYHHGNNTFRLRCNYPDVIDVLIEIGHVCRKLGMLPESFTNYQEALSRQAKPSTPAEKLRLVKTFIGLGSVKRQQGDADDAKRCLIRALEVATQVLGSNHHYVASIIGQIGELSYSQGVLPDAIHHHLRDLKLTQNEVGIQHPRVAAILNNIALVLDDLNNKTAGNLFQAVLAILVEAYGKDHLDVAIVRYNLGTFFLSNNLFQRAEFQFSESLRIFTRFLGEDHTHTKEAILAKDKVRDIKN
ncbi:uncharacterized protein [Amphiura filiformis]|uniref:uncharacterized protein n=1 Tax=Amphiura filiformis TaxID=82378 RepID=UPI003B21A225